MKPLKSMVIRTGENIEVFNFLNHGKRTIPTGSSDGSILSGHGGGNYFLMKNFVEALASQDQDRILSGPQESLESHLLVFTAEDARKQGTVEKLVDYWKQP